MIPTREECFQLMNRFAMPEHIVRHSIQVARVALFLSTELNKNGQEIDLRLVEAAALLHDLTKSKSFRTEEDHALSGSNLLTEMGYEKVGEVVSAHIHLKKGETTSWVSEKEVVNYADKRVQHDRIVSLSERFDDLKERYGKSREAIVNMEKMKKVTLGLELKIFASLHFDPSDLESLFLGEGREVKRVVR